MTPTGTRPDQSGVLAWVEGDDIHVRELRPRSLNAWWDKRIALWSVGFAVHIERADGRRRRIGQRPEP